MPRKNKTRQTLKKESEDEFVLKNSFKANTRDRYFTEGKKKNLCKSVVLRIIILVFCFLCQIKSTPGN